MQISKWFSGFGFLFICCVLIISITACSSIMNGSIQNVDVKSTEAESQIFVNGILNGTAPTVVKLHRGESYLIEVKKPGYETYRITTSKTITGWFWGNLICGGLVGMVIDLTSGNAYDVEPRFINAQLNKTTAMLGNFNSDDFSQIFIKDKTGNIVNTFVIDWD